jgi:hypothetical protein
MCKWLRQDAGSTFLRREGTHLEKPKLKSGDDLLERMPGKSHKYL